jgi:hypothetical protein
MVMHINFNLLSDKFKEEISEILKVWIFYQVKF